MTHPTLPHALLLLLPLPWRPGQAQGEIRHVSGWTLNVRSDRFRGGQVCKLFRPRIDYQRKALVLHLPADTDTTGAIYRIDNGPPLHSNADDAQIVSLGFALHNDDLDNPSGGLVRIPVRRLLGAHSVKVETAAFGRLATFKLEGLDAALAAAQAAGCGVGDFQ